MDRQIFELTGRTVALTDLVPTQDAAGSLEAGKNTMQELKELVQGGKIYRTMASLSGGVFTKTIELSDFGATTFTFTNPSNGLVTVTANSAVFTTNKTAGRGGGIYDAGTQYFLSGVAFSTTVFNFRIVLHDGTAASTPSFTNILFEIIVGN